LLVGSLTGTVAF